MNLKSDFRDVMKEIPTSVSIVLVRDREEIKGCTISSLVSIDISSENPHVMFVLRKDSSTGESIQSGRDFSINLLNQNQIHIAKDRKSTRLNSSHSSVSRMPSSA